MKDENSIDIDLESEDKWDGGAVEGEGEEEVGAEKGEVGAEKEEVGAEKAEGDIKLEAKGKKIIAYLVTDRPVHGLINYFRECGINISNIYTSIKSARNTILMQTEPCRIIISDTGLGKFTTTRTRQELIDMIGICDENNKVTVFYTDSVLKVDSVKELGKDNIGIDWHKYTGTINMAVNILNYNEEYILDDAADDPDDVPNEDALDGFNGLSSGIEMAERIISSVQTENIVKEMLEDTEGLLPNYDVNL